MKNKIKLFTHTDLDGVSCVVLAKLAFCSDNVDYEMCDYNNINEKIKDFIANKQYDNYDHIYIYI
jgi:oligoribonuclease NrnB/cAMP/cGMP phosphodiesterase (DHH superfamily)